MTSFLFLFALLNVITPIVIITKSNWDEISSWSPKQRSLIQNMFVTGVCLLFVSVGMYALT